MDTGPLGGEPASTRDSDRLSLLHVVVDGSGPLIGWTTAALRSVGVGRVTSGPYAGELGLWTRPAPARVRTTVARPPGRLAGVHAVIAVSAGVLHPSVAAPWHQLGLTHLPVELHDGLIQIGPLVIPGASGCLSCRDGWRPEVASRSALDVDPGVGVLTAAIAALTIRQALLGDHAMAGVSCDIVGARPEIVHRYWGAHPQCPCLADRRRGA